MDFHPSLAQIFEYREKLRLGGAAQLLF